MKFETYFSVTSYAMIASAFMALALTGELDALSVVLYACAFVACFYVDAQGITKWRLKEWMWRALTALYIPFMLFDAIGLSPNNKVLALVHLSLFASAAKLYQNKTDRDWVFLYLIAFFQMLLAAGLTFNATFVASLIAFLFFFISTLAAFEIRRAQRSIAGVQEEVITRAGGGWEKSPKKGALGDGAAARKVRRVRYLVVASLIQAVIIIVLTLPFFFMIPRFTSANVGNGFGNSVAATGFSDTVELGNIANIKQTRRIVLRVKLDREVKKYLRWRGIALDHYDGKSWSLTPLPDRYTRQDQFRKGAGEEVQSDANFSRKFTITQPEDKQELVKEEFTLEPLSTNTIFAAKTVRDITIETGSIRPDKYTEALSVSGLRGKTVYTVTSDIHTPGAEELRAAAEEYPPEFSKGLYFQKPTVKDRASFDPRIKKLAQEITVSARNNYDRARAIEEYLKTQFSYSLDLKMGGDDPLAEFLFETREGHCEYFATAMVMMLRSIGIPARIVNGFQMGEFNQLTERYTVRESDAHSWVEVYFPAAEAATTAPSKAARPAGHWVEFDPTPSAGINDYSQGGIAASLRKYIDAMEVFWLDYVVTLDRDEQASMLVEVQQRLINLKNQALRYYKAAKDWIGQKVDTLFDTDNWNLRKTIALIGGVCAVALLILAVYVALAYRKRRGLAPTGYNPWWYRLFVAPALRLLKRKRGDHQASAVLFYEQMLAIAARAGLVKEPSQTPLEFAAASGFAEIGEITRVYNRVRFGNAALKEDEARRVAGWLTDLKQAIASR